MLEDLCAKPLSMAEGVRVRAYTPETPLERVLAVQDLRPAVATKPLDEEKEEECARV